MYHCLVNFYFIGCSKDLIQSIREITPPAQFTFQFEENSTLFEIPTHKADVIFADMHSVSTEDLDLIYSYKKKEADLILLADKEQVSALTVKELPTVSDLWTLPLTKGEITFRFSKWFQTYKMRKDFWLCQNYLDTTINSVPHLIWYKDKEGAHLKVNTSFCKAVNKTMEQVEGRYHYYIWDIDPDEYAKGEFICMESEYEVMNKKETCIFDENVKIRDEMRQLETYKSPLFDLDGSVMGTVGIAVDVTQERLYEQMIIKNANTDFLTGLYNRRYAYQFMEEQVGKPLTVFYLDLDNFKAVNDRYGHQEGDRALLVTTRVLKECMPKDTIARIGGDEFLIVSVDPYTIQDIARAKEMLQRRLDQTYAGDEHLKGLSASIGVAHSEDGAVIMDSLIGEADVLMYQEKSRKKAASS